MRLYVAGPMTGIERHNYPLFNRTAAILRSLGHEVWNPAENDSGKLDVGDWSYYMRKDLVHMSKVDGVVVLPGFKRSKGASLEVRIAQDLGMTLYRLEEEPYSRLLPPYDIIGLSGYAQSGKDTAAAFLAADGYQRVAFADGLRRGLLALDPGVYVKQLSRFTYLSLLVDEFGWDQAKAFPEVRQLLQRFGTEVGRQVVGPNVWVDLAFRDLEVGGRYVFTDMRFPNELEAVRSWGGEAWRIRRPGFEPVNKHVSETALDGVNFDRWIENDGSLTDFEAKVRRVLT